MNAKAAGGVYSGLLGATTSTKQLVTSDTGESFATQLYRSINIADDPDLFERLRDGSLHRVECPFTEATYDLAVPVVCHDPQRRVFALVIADALRWDEFRLRHELLDELVEDGTDIPSYVRNFAVVIDPSEVLNIDEGIADVSEAEMAAPEEATTVASKPQDATNVAVKPAKELAKSKELARKRAELENEQRKLEVERDQLDAVRTRFDKEREQMDDAQAQLQSQREELARLKEALELERRELQTQRLNEEGEQLRAQAGTSEAGEESTQVVTDDQFIEVVDADEVSLADADSVVQLGVDEVVIANIDAEIPEEMSDLTSSTQQSAVKILNDRVIAVAQVAPDLVEQLFAEEPTFFVQLHEADGYPVVTLLLARLDERQQAISSFCWALDPAPDGDRLILSKLQGGTKLRVAFFGPTGSRLRAIEVAAPYEANITWMLKKADTLLGRSGRGTYADARTTVLEDNEKLGTMRHNFTPHSFEEATSPSAVKLAAGIVGYWSKPDTYEYLIANRAFPLKHFRGIQERVVRRAVEAGIFINEPLRDVAMELGLARTPEALLDLLVANFAEAAISIRANDLEPADQWENWDALLTFGDEMGVPPDPDVVELADVSLKHAREEEELAERSEIEIAATIEEQRANIPSPDDSLVIAKQSESTGVTYFLPGDAVLDTFDDLAEMPREDLELLLNDAAGRLEAAQMLIERFGATGTSRVMETAEKMSSSEVAALAKFLESKAGGLEAELVRCVESGGPSAVYMAGRALASVQSTTAIPALLDAARDPEKHGDANQFAQALALYGSKLLPALNRAIKRDGPQHNLVLLLAYLEDEEEGTLSELSKNRSKNLRDAAKLARELRDSKSA